MATVKHQTPSGDDEFGMMKAQWSFVLHVLPHPLPLHKLSLWIHHGCVGICNDIVACNDGMGVQSGASQQKWSGFMA